MPRLIGLFQTQNHADRCVTELELHGFTAREIAVIRLEAEAKPARSLAEWLANGGVFGDTMDQSDGVSVVDGATVGASLAALWGVAWGSRLPGGPVVVGLIALLLGGLVGFCVDHLIPEKRRRLYAVKKQKGLLQVEITTADPKRLAIARETMRRSSVDQLAEVPDQPADEPDPWTIPTSQR